ncbi:hypothetical protein [Jeotgalibaca arthritidis]|uniref:PilN domain-containing protein n=1 Tax=Jeotgalibaca arthritidis TaxID=1868794 RepID=A0A6G7K867_9LACT|nr:hypothetical protein [Jeotgalibaca arthritidis]QII81432.1 hypothetical protein G7057_02360 [Jeotgalibaca arthritidis]
MFELNFFEKKKTNFLPHLLTALFAVLLLLSGLYFFFSYQNYVNIDKDNQYWLLEEADQLALARQMQSYDQLTKQLLVDQVYFEENQYPINTVIQGLNDQLADQSDHLLTFSLNTDNQVTFVLENSGMTDISAAIDRFSKLDYVTKVQLVRLEETESDYLFLAELRVDLNEEAIEEGE